MRKSWADHAKEKLRVKEDVVVKPRGNSMTPIIKSGQEILLKPLVPQCNECGSRNISGGDLCMDCFQEAKHGTDVSEPKLEKGDVVLARVKGADYLHKISAIEGDRIQISNNHGHVNGWTNRSKLYGKADLNVDVEFERVWKEHQRIVNTHSWKYGTWDVRCIFCHKTKGDPNLGECRIGR